MTAPILPPLPLALVVDDDATFRMRSRMSLEQEDLRVEEEPSRSAKPTPASPERSPIGRSLQNDRALEKSSCQLTSCTHRT